MNSGDISAATEIYCIFGRPVRHSLSPAMQNAAFRARGINAVYCAFEPSSIEDAVRSMRALGIHGASVTIPFKVDALPLCDEVDHTAAAIGSVNTLENREGRIIGHNTDGEGAVLALERAGVRPAGSACLIIGNGGSARAIAFALMAAGARVVITGRNRARIEGLAADLGRNGARVPALCIDEIDREFIDTVGIVINTTPVGMAPDTSSTPIDPSLLRPCHAVFDIIYAPHRTRLIDEASSRGCTVVHGIDMLVLQGARQFEIWTGSPAPIEEMRRAVAAHGQGGHDT